MNFNGWKNKENGSYTYNGILFNLKREENPVICYNMHEPWGHNGKWHRSVQKNRGCMIPFKWGIWSSQKCIRKVVSKTGLRGSGELFGEYKVSLMPNAGAQFWESIAQQCACGWT